MKKIIVTLMVLLGMSIPFGLWAQTFPGEPILYDEDIGVVVRRQYEKNPLDTNITEGMGSRYELPRAIFDLTRLPSEHDDDNTVIIQMSPYGQGGTIFYRLKNGGYAIDTDFNVRGLFEKLVRLVDDPKRRFLLMREFPFYESEDDGIPLLSQDPYLDLTYVGDPKVFTSGSLTPAWQIGASSTVHMVVMIPEETYKKVLLEYDAAEKKAADEEDETDALGGKSRNEYTKGILEILLKRIST